MFISGQKMNQDSASEDDGGGKLPSSKEDSEKGDGSAPDGGVSQLIASALAAHAKLPQTDGQQGGAATPKRKAGDDSLSSRKLARSTSAEATVASASSPGTMAQSSADMASVMRALQGQSQPTNSGGAFVTGDIALRLRAEMSSQLLREQLERATAFRGNVLPLSLMGQPSLGSLLRSSALGGLRNIGPTLPTLQTSLLQDQEAQRLSTLRQLADLHSISRSHQNLTQSLADNAIGFNSHALAGRSSLLSLMQLPSQSSALSRASLEDLLQQRSQLSRASSQTSASPSGASQSLPPIEESNIEPFSTRPKFPLGIDEDPNWLSEFHCFVRSELVEIFLASQEDVKTRNNSIEYRQVGLRCRFCAHLAPNLRAGRSSAFPSSMRQIYQSFTMMLRDHFAKCEAIPKETKDRFLTLREMPAQGATDSKRFWVYSAMKAGMADSSNGIVMNELSVATGAAIPPFGSDPSIPWADSAYASTPLVKPEDRDFANDFVFLLMTQVQMVRLTEAEQIGNRRSLLLGLPGFGCRYCCAKRRLGLCRVFPARRRTLATKVHDMYDHIRRCTLCPSSVKEQLEKLCTESSFNMDLGDDKEFFDRVWTRLGHNLSRG